MKIKMIISILLLTFILGGCSSTGLPSGIYMSNDPADLPFPTSGYAVYIVGETHGNKEAKWVFQAYLQNLYKEAGIRDVVLEEDQGHETDANDYVLGLTDEFPAALCLRADILGQIREFNASLPAEAKVHVQLVDVDSPLNTIHKHLKELQAQMGPAADTLQIPYASELKNWSPEQKDELVEQFREAAKDQPEIMSELDTIQQSFHWYELGNRLEIGPPSGDRPTFAPIREDVMTQNIQHVLSQLNGKPILAYFGAGHGMKNYGDYNPPVEGFTSWAQRLVESDVPVYSVAIEAKAGKGYWHKEPLTYEIPGQQQYGGTSGYRFPDGISLVSLFETHPDQDILYVDLRAGDNASIQLPATFDPDLTADQVYDGLIIFEEFTPMEDACLP